MKIKENLSTISIFLAGVILLGKLLVEYQFCLYFFEMMANTDPGDIGPTVVTNGTRRYFVMLLLLPITLSVLGFWRGNRYRRISIVFNAVTLILTALPVLLMLAVFLKG